MVRIYNEDWLDKMNMEEYIKEIKPDYVVVLYTDVGDSSFSRYDFFM